jgi:membrane protease YdiL (CAAX protease family)
MDEHKRHSKEIPAWIRIPAGILIALFTLLCLVGTVTIFMSLKKDNLVFGIFIGTILLIGCLWVLIKSIRIVLNVRRKNGLLAPLTLRLFGIFFLLLPVGGIFTGYFKEIGVVAVIQTILHIGICFVLFRHAKTREIECKN